MHVHRPPDGPMTRRMQFRLEDGSGKSKEREWTMANSIQQRN
jgi:hypothetical protein